MASHEQYKRSEYSLSSHGQPGERRYRSAADSIPPALADAILEYKLNQEKAQAERRALKRSLYPWAR